MSWGNERDFVAELKSMSEKFPFWFVIGLTGGSNQGGNEEKFAMPFSIYEGS
jgi:hypothetical protein